jgi:hypothetical protein
MTEEDILELCRALEQYKEALELSENEVVTLHDRIASLEDSHEDAEHRSQIEVNT